jgi:hypothetical protein
MPRHCDHGQCGNLLAMGCCPGHSLRLATGQGHSNLRHAEISFPQGLAARVGLVPSRGSCESCPRGCTCVGALCAPIVQAWVAPAQPLASICMRIAYLIAIAYMRRTCMCISDDVIITGDPSITTLHGLLTEAQGMLPMSRL